MALYQWDDALSVGNQHIDDDHKQLIDLVASLNEAMRTGQNKDVVGKILDDLVRSTVNHFEREEGFMRQIDYVDYQSHKAEHERLVREVKDLQERFDNGSITITVSVSNFLADWLRNHIQGLDKKLAAAIAVAHP
ncbi:MAG: bacteriohemerythrin [Proteobacteria bacterium]|nr:bacteriohemerythrin [Pseudomonadota bacterium]